MEPLNQGACSKIFYLYLKNPKSRLGALSPKLFTWFESNCLCIASCPSTCQPTPFVRLTAKKRWKIDIVYCAVFGNLVQFSCPFQRTLIFIFDHWKPFEGPPVRNLEIVGWGFVENTWWRVLRKFNLRNSIQRILTD